MKHLSLLILAFLSLSANAQKNVFLERSYWKSAPDVTKVKSEIEKGNSPSQITNSGFDATVYAILEGAPMATVQFLLDQKGNDVNKITHDERTYIFWAAYKGNTELMEYLLTKGAKTNLRDDKGFTPLSFAAANGQTNTKVYDICLREGANLEKDLDLDGANALLLMASTATDFTLIDYFTSKGLSLQSTDASGNTVFDYATRTGNIPFLKELVAKGVKYNDNALIMASKGTRSHANTIDVYQYLETLKLKPTVLGKNGENVLHSIVIKEKQNDVIAYFIGKGVNVNQADNEGNTPFLNAASSNSDLAVLTLLSTKVKNINQENKKGISALAFAVKNNTPEVVAFLLKNGADVAVTDSNGDNLSYYLLQSYNPQKSEIFEAKLKLLEEKGLKITAPQKNGNTLYHLAVAKNDFSLIKRIESFKIDANVKNKEGMTALHKAALVAQDDVILKYLISIGAKTDAKTEFKETAFDLASENETLSKNKTSIEFLK